jgi:hypothetical protein
VTERERIVQEIERRLDEEVAASRHPRDRHAARARAYEGLLRWIGEMNTIDGPDTPKS